VSLSIIANPNPSSRLNHKLAIGEIRGGSSDLDELVIPYFIIAHLSAFDIPRVTRLPSILAAHHIAQLDVWQRKQDKTTKIHM